LKYEKLLAYDLYKHATSVNFDTNYVSVSCLVFELCQFWYLWGRARNFGEYVQGGRIIFDNSKYYRTS